MRRGNLLNNHLYYYKNLPHMKKTLLLIGCLACFLSLQAQDDVACVPDPAFADSSFVVSPLPLDPATGLGGIEAFPACIGEPYELVVSFRIGDSTSFNGFDVNLIRAEIAQTGAIEGLPEGINYLCNPPDCIFPDTTLGCIVLTGTPTSNNPIGVNKLVITAQVVLEALGTITETIPGMLVSGEYNLMVNEAGGCTSVSTNDFLANNITLGNIPNPVIDQTLIEVSSEINGAFQFHVLDVAGKLLHSEKIQLTTGYNSFNYDASELEAGMYIYSISNELGAIAEKMVVGRR